MYTNEAHPADEIPAHRSLDDKLACARRLRDEIGIRREILVDALDGPVHQSYGHCPNMTWVLGRGGVILYKGMWTSAGEVEAYVANLPDLARPGWAPFYSEQIELRPRDTDRFQAGLARNGPRSVEEFRRATEIWTARAKEAARARRRTG